MTPPKPLKNWERDLKDLTRLIEVPEDENGEPVYLDGDKRWGFKSKELIDFISELLSQREKEILEEAKREVEEMPTKYPVDIFSEPWKGWEKDIDKLAKSKGYRVDSFSAHFARWQEKIVKSDLSAYIQIKIDELKQ